MYMSKIKLTDSSPCVACVLVLGIQHVQPAQWDEALLLMNGVSCHKLHLKSIIYT